MLKLFLPLFLILTVSLFNLVKSKRELAITPPLPILPLPTYAQLEWQQREIIMFLHFGINTFTDSEWGTGKENPSIFNPSTLNANQWASVAEEVGIILMILTAKHHDGFCLWPSQYTDHSVISSTWKDGHGDVVEEFVNAAKARNIDVGLYLSPWDRHDWRYGDDLKYNQYYLAQLQELLKRYGSVKEIWFDGAKGAGAPNMSTKHDIQRHFNGFRYVNMGDEKGTDWSPPECDTSIRPGWFWHASETPKNLTRLLEIYYTSVGRNCVLLINVPPNSTGLISDIDAQRMREFRSAIDTIFSVNLAENCSVKASSQLGREEGRFGPRNVLDNDHLWTYWAPSDEDDQWIEMNEENEGWRFNVIRIQEAIGLGQRIKQHEIYADGKIVANGTTVGYKRLHRLEGVVHANQVSCLALSKRELVIIPPLPILPLPTYDQLEWQQREIIMFLHFGINTFTDSEWGTGKEKPSIFNPTSLNANQWASVAKEVGISLMILTAKHQDGFCLWPSQHTDHSVISSPWKDGHGDAVEEFVNAAKAPNINVDGKIVAYGPAVGYKRLRRFEGVVHARQVRILKGCLWSLVLHFILILFGTQISYYFREMNIINLLPLRLSSWKAWKNFDGPTLARLGLVFGLNLHPFSSDTGPGGSA
ncbi:Glycoside hydrolase, family 29 [Dillenia turbinata]|uniref:alpha-L-fucosidase n=1 Tax=Dillenia turbinata TaxID=194707 RepID=A0AAN8Z654_9MAGN